MTDESRDGLVRDWIVKARHDLESARKLAGGVDPYRDTAIYHCQQAAEKVFKGFLVFHDQRFEKTHDVTVLLELAQKYETSLLSLQDAAELLAPYATEFRYPGKLEEPSKEEFEQALVAAAEVVSSVCSVLPVFA